MYFRTAAQALLDEVAAICQSCGRDPSEVSLLAVSKTFSVESMNQYLEETSNILGLPLLGENKVQEVIYKKPLLLKHQLHFIGHLQSNKVRKVLPHIDYLHSLDSNKLAEILEQELNKLDRRLPVLIQANTSGEENKFGGGWKNTLEVYLQARTLPHLDIRGLMTIAPLTEDHTILHMTFSRLREWRDRLQKETGDTLPELSMGMSHDYRIAIEEGATLIRIGSALFGRRDYKKQPLYNSNRLKP